MRSKAFLRSESPALTARKRTSPILVLIVGGSGSGKTWLANKLQQALAPQVTRLSLDDFYRDRCHLSPARRAQLNFDHPRAIDWGQVESVLNALLAGRAARVPVYDFKTHSRRANLTRVKPRPLIVMEGLWLLRRSPIRRLASLSIFLDCPSSLRLQRRILRDQAARGRTRASIQEQFNKLVEPMHVRYVASQAALADIVFRAAPGNREVRVLANRLRLSTKPGSAGRPVSPGRPR
jgi:uridine kinase